jgi:phenylacetate-CoA ligase
LLSRAAQSIRSNIIRFPNALNMVLLHLNRRPEYLFGPEYARFKKLLLQPSSFDQSPRLLASVKAALQDVPYYRMRYGGARLETIHDFEETFDFIDKDTVLSHYKSFISEQINLADYDIGTTGGTSGKPMQLIAPKKRYPVELASMHTIWGRAGYRFDMRGVIRNHHLDDGEVFRVNPLTREVVFDGFRLNSDYFGAVYKTIRRFGIRFIHCYPSTAYEFAVFMHREGLETSFLSAFLSGSENIFDHQVDLIQKRMNIRFYNWYGHSEKLILAGYCESSNLYHVEPAYGYFELIDENGHVVRKPGRIGEMVGTSFYNPGMPLIRYRTGDYAEFVGPECPLCGRRVPVLCNITGRWSGDRIYNSDGSFVTTTALNLHNDLYSVIDGIQYIQEEKGRLDVLIIKSRNFMLYHEQQMLAHFREKLHRDATVRIVYVDRLIRQPNGKFLQLISGVVPETE